MAAKRKAMTSEEFMASIQKSIDKANAQQEKIRLTNKAYKHHIAVLSEDK